MAGMLYAKGRTAELSPAMRALNWFFIIVLLINGFNGGVLEIAMSPSPVVPGASK